MKTLSLSVILALGLATVGTQVIEACGAKFLVSSRSARFQRFQSVQPAEIYLYWDEIAADEAEAQQDLEEYEAFRAFLESVGYTIEATTEEAAFREAVRTGDYDIILMPLDAARRLRGDIATLAPAATLLPVVEFATRAVKAQAEEEFGGVLDTPATTRHVLSVFADALGG